MLTVAARKIRDVIVVEDRLIVGIDEISQSSKPGAAYDPDIGLYRNLRTDEPSDPLQVLVS